MIFSHILKSWKHHSSLQIATLFVLSFSFSLVISILVVNFNLEKIISLWGENIQMNVYIKPDANTDHISQVETFLNGNSNLDNIKKISKEESLEQFKNQFQQYAADLVDNDDLLKLIPLSFQFNLISNAEEDLIKKISDVSSQIKSFSAVEEVSYGQDWIKNYTAFTSGTKNVTMGVSLVIILASLFGVSNSIRASIDQRKEDVAILELIGATTLFIRKPYLWEGLLFSFASTWIAIAMTAILFVSGRAFLTTQPFFTHIANHLEYLSFSNQVILSVIGGLLGLAVSYLHVRRLNTGWLDSGIKKIK